MALLKYTTTINVAKTLAELQAILADHGVKSILIEYTDGVASGLMFVIPTRFGDRTYRLPANLDGIYHVLQDQWEAGRIARRFATPEQAARVGWRILRDWVAAQTAIVEAGMVELAEVMTPYMQREPGGPTLYQELVKHELQLLPEHTP